MKCYRHACKLMGTAFELAIVSDSEDFAKKQLTSGVEEISRIEAVLTEFKDDSLTSLVNQNAGKQSVTVTEEFVQLLKRSLNISRLSQGYFDISVAPLKQLFRFKNEDFQPPTDQEVSKTLDHVGFQHIDFSENPPSTFLKQSGMKISFAAIGKGYAADRVVKLWKENDVQSGYVNASGDLTAFGTNENNEPWKVGIADPAHPAQSLFSIPMHHLSLATSGDYEQYFIHEGVKYSHNINPLTGKPVQDLASVSVISPSAELSDALATAISAMGIKKGINFVNQLPHTHAVIIDSHREVFLSKNLKYENISQ